MKTAICEPRPFDATERHSAAAGAKVILLTNFIPPHALPVYAELARRVGHLTVLLSTPMEANRSWRPDFGDLDVRVQRTVTLSRRWRHAAGFQDKLFVHVPYDTLGQLRKLRPDVVLSTEMGFRSLFSALHCCLSRNTRLALWTGLSEHTEQGRGLPRRLLRKLLLRRADAVAVNGASGERYLTACGARPEQLFRVPYVAVPMNAPTQSRRRPADDVRRLLCVGQLIERKGVLPFAQALAQWGTKHPERHIELSIVGSGPLKLQIAEIGCPANVQLNLLGERTLAEVAELYASHDICVFPTLADEWGLVVNEALAAGLPVLGSLYGQSAEELCRDGQTGWTYRPNEPGELAAALDKALAASPDELLAMGQAARESVAPITAEFAADRVVEMIDAMLGNGERLKAKG